MMDELEAQARKDNEARDHIRKAIRLWIALGYSEEEIIEMVEELYSEEQG